VHLEVSAKSHVHQKIEIFWTNIASTMAYPNFQNGPKIGLRPLGVKDIEHKAVNHYKNYMILNKFPRCGWWNYHLIYL
jgi:hypothetical protein